MDAWTSIVTGWHWGLSGWTILSISAEILAVLSIPSVLLQRRGQPRAALSWILGLMALPFFGVLLWWGIGRNHLKRKREEKAQAHWPVAKGFASLRRYGLDEEAAAEDGFLPLERIPEEESYGVFPAIPGNRVRILLDGEQTYGALEEMVRSAKHHIHFLFYIWRPDAVGIRFRDLLTEKAEEGVEVRILCDAVGSGASRGGFFEPVERAGGRVAFFMPAQIFRRRLTLNFRNHRKIAVVDGRAAYTGGLNLGDEYVKAWRDLGLLIEGPAVTHLQEIFADDWHYAAKERLGPSGYTRFVEGLSGGGASCQIIAGGPDSRHNPTHDAFFIAITRARRRIWITSPFLIPDTAIQTALRTAVYRGVDVRLLVPRKTDAPLTQTAGRSFYPALLSTGVRIYEYLPGILHAKLWIFDGDLASVGSANLDTRSFKLNFETTCFLGGRDLTRRLADIFERDLLQSEEITLEHLKARGAASKILESATHLLAPLL